jgi:hypothetical protein
VKALIWGAFVFFAAIWTGGVALTVALVRAAVGMLSPVHGAGVPDVLTAPPIPDWLAPWVDILGWREWIQGTTALLESLLAVLPSLGQMLDWLVPLAWIVWGIGLIGLFVLALIGSKLTSRFSR